MEAKGNLQRMRADTPLMDGERAAVEGGTEALDRLLERLGDVPTPRQLTGKTLSVLPTGRG